MIRLEMTCVAFPEQYDAYVGEEKVGYLRLRHGRFTVNCPDAEGSFEFEAEPQGQGMFDDDERGHYLVQAKKAILGWLHRYKRALVDDAAIGEAASTVPADVQQDRWERATGLRSPEEARDRIKELEAELLKANATQHATDRRMAGFIDGGVKAAEEFDRLGAKFEEQQKLLAAASKHIQDTEPMLWDLVEREMAQAPKLEAEDDIRRVCDGVLAIIGRPPHSQLFRQRAYALVQAELEAKGVLRVDFSGSREHCMVMSLMAGGNGRVLREAVDNMPEPTKCGVQT